jgi:hypothetical protein
MMDKVRKLNSPDCNTPSSEPFSKTIVKQQEEKSLNGVPRSSAISKQSRKKCLGTLPYITTLSPYSI